MEEVVRRARPGCARAPARPRAPAPGGPVPGADRVAGRRPSALRCRLCARSRGERPGHGRDRGAAQGVRRALGAGRARRPHPGRRRGPRTASGLGRRRGGDGGPLPPDRGRAALPLRAGRAPRGHRRHRLRGRLRNLARLAPGGPLPPRARAARRRLRPARRVHGVGRGPGQTRAAGARRAPRGAAPGGERRRRGRPDGRAPAVRAVRARSRRTGRVRQPGGRRPARHPGREPARHPAVGDPALAERPDVRGPLPGGAAQPADHLVRGAAPARRLALLPALPQHHRAQRAHHPGPRHAPGGRPPRDEGRGRGVL